MFGYGVITTSFNNLSRNNSSGFSDIIPRDYIARIVQPLPFEGTITTMTFGPSIVTCSCSSQFLIRTPLLLPDIPEWKKGIVLAHRSRLMIVKVGGACIWKGWNELVGSYGWNSAIFMHRRIILFYMEYADLLFI